MYLYFILKISRKIKKINQWTTKETDILTQIVKRNQGFRKKDIYKVLKCNTPYKVLLKLRMSKIDFISL